MRKLKRVLLIEDDETANFISKVALKSAGVENVDEVLNGKEACDYLDTYCPDFIFLDIKMPVMDGWEFLDEKRVKGLCKKIKVAMLTSSVHPDDKKKSENYSCVIAYIEKPLTKEKIEMIMDELTSVK